MCISDRAPGDDYIAIENGQCVWKEDITVQVDAVEFKRLLEESRAADDDDKLHILQEAWLLYRGPDVYKRQEFETNNRMVAATKLQEEDSVVSVTMINGETDVVLQTTNGTFLRFPLEEISVLKKASRGVRGIRLAKNEELETVYLIGENPIIDYKGKEVHLNSLKLAKRDGKVSKVRLN